MGSTTWGTVITVNGKSVTYEARYTYKGRRVCKRFKDRLSAQAWLNGEKSLVEADKTGKATWTHPGDRTRLERAENRRKTLLCDYVETSFAPTWLRYSDDGSELAASSQRKHREYLAHLRKAEFWTWPIHEITAEDINRWLHDLSNFNNGPTPRKKTFQLLKAVYAKAESEGVVAKSPVTMKSPSVPKSRQAQIPPATGEELRIIYENMPETCRLAVWLGAVLDLRIGEVVALQVRDYEPNARVLHVRHSADEHGRLKETKTAASTANQPVPPMLAGLLAAACEGRRPDERIIHGAKTPTISANRLRDHFDKAKLAAGRPDLHFHTLRATSITTAVQVGASLRDTMQWGRHTDAATSIERYQRASGNERMRQIADGIEAKLMGHEPDEEELIREITLADERLAGLRAQLDALRQRRSRASESASM